MEIVDVVGVVGATASVASFAPQAWKIIRERRTQGLSVVMYLLTCLAFAAWTSFGILRGEWALIVPNTICLLLAGFILWMIVLPQRKVEDVSKTLDPSS